MIYSWRKRGSDLGTCGRPCWPAPSVKPRQLGCDQIATAYERYRDAAAATAHLATWAALDALVTAELPGRIAMEANSIQAVQTAVGAGLGESAMARSAVTGGLKILDGYPELPQTCRAAYVRAMSPHPLADRFVAFLAVSW